jgi:nitric oxide reductase activation protein
LDSGLVDPSRIYGLAMGETDIFRKKGIDRKFDGCVYVLVDNSGSMSGNKRLEACKAAAVIEEGFKGIIPMKIVAFDTCGHIVHEVIKGWDESQKLNCCWNFANHGRNGCGNDDNQDIMVAQRELLSRPEEKKLLIVLSDGAPADTTATRIAIENTRKKGIKVFGIYFEEGQIGRDAKTFKDMYQKDYVCCELNQVDEHLTKLMIQFSRS